MELGTTAPLFKRGEAVVGDRAGIAGKPRILIR
jgi:hypothetical protein